MGSAESERNERRRVREAESERNERRLMGSTESERNERRRVREAESERDEPRRMGSAESERMGSAALQTYEDNTNIKYLFSASEKPLSAVQRADQRNVQGLILFNPIILDSPWEKSSTQDQDIIKLLEEKAPLIMAKARPASATTVLTSHEMQIQNNAVDAMKSSLKLLLARIQKVTSHTFHVFLWELIPGAKVGRSLLFTRIVEHRNQYLTATRSKKNIKPYSAMDTLKFIEDFYVQSNENSVHIAWTAILSHTRELLQPLYQWQASFDSLARKYEQSKTKGLVKTELRKLKVLIAKQITDDEKVILAGLEILLLQLRISTTVNLRYDIFRKNYQKMQVDFSLNAIPRTLAF
jgi:hypothetical protein